MQFLQTFAGLFANFGNLTWQMVVMWVIGGLLIYLAIAKKMEPSLLLPMGFGAILVNLPLSGAITQGDTAVSYTHLGYRTASAGYHKPQTPHRRRRTRAGRCGCRPAPPCQKLWQCGPTARCV